MNRDFLKAFLLSFVFLSIGFLLLHFDYIGYGLSIFVFLPFSLGYIYGKSIVRKVSLLGLIFSIVCFFLLLLAGGLEGMGCILMALPIVLVVMFIGIIIKKAISQNEKYNKKDDLIKSSILPLFIFLGLGFLEKNIFKTPKAINEVKTEMIFPYTTSQVYNAIKSVDTLIAKKPFFMTVFDLPVPQKCILEKEAVGGLRTCYFKGGTIVEKITQLEPEKVLRMDVIDYKLTGRKWLGFKEAIYYFEKVGNDSCKLIRITTYSSVLQPRFYWQPLEELGIRQEHDYVFENLENDLKKKLILFSNL